MKLRAGPTIEAMTPDQEIEVRRLITEAIMRAWWDTGSWTAADRAAAELLDQLRAAGCEVVRVRWPR